MKNIGIITSTRAEYGLLYPLIKSLRKYECNELKISLIVTGTHLSTKYGMTISEIIASGQRIDEIVSVGVDSKSPIDIAKNQASTVIEFTKLFCKVKYDAICILGDRYEIQMVAIAATNTEIPIFHLCGGDTTEGAVDESIRHSITKMSYLHFVTNEISKRRVIQLGEDPSRVYNVGSTSVDNIVRMKLMQKEEVLQEIDLEDCEYALCTYHPTTLNNQKVEEDIIAFVNAIGKHTELQFIVTKANADKGGEIINSILNKEEDKLSNLHVYDSLGQIRYLSLMKYAKFVMGNSSSGIVEAPIFHVPVINIGDRQCGRLQAKDTINCGGTTEEIMTAIDKVSLVSVRERSADLSSPYGDGNAAERMAEVILKRIQEPIVLKKKFWDLRWKES